MNTFYARFLLILITFSSFLFSLKTQNITLSNQMQVDTFSLTEVGNLTVSGSDITNIQSLSSLREVSGNFFIVSNPNLERIQLPNLISVGNRFNIAENNTLNLIEIPELREVGSTSTSADFRSSLNIVNNASLVEISGFENLTSIANFLTIQGNDILENISGFSALRTTGRDIRIQNNNQLEQITGFGELSNVGVDLLLVNLTDLATLTNFPSLTTIGRTLRIVGNTNIENFEFIDLSTVSGNIEVTDNGDLTNISFPELTDIDARLLINENASLTVLGFPRLREVGSTSTSADFRSSLNIVNNASLAAISGFENLTSIANFLTIEGNPSLLEITGLEELIQIGRDLRVRNNPVLSNCCGLKRILSDEGNIGVSILISDNPSECSSQEEILVSQACGNNPCPNQGQSCNDGDSATENDIVDANCNCVGTVPPPVFDCVDLMLNIGDVCDDGDSATENDVVDNDCNCRGIIVMDDPDCFTLSLNVGDACTDGDGNTGRVNADCNCEIVNTGDFDCPEFMANIGQPCDDDDPNTDNEWLEEGCKCVGQIINGCNAIITVRDNTIIVEGVNGAHIKVHLFDRTFSNAINTDCNFWNDCQGTQTFENLLPGVYAVQYQSFNEDWTNILCDSVAYVEIVGPSTQGDCQDIDIQVVGNTVTIDEFPTLNTIVDVFDPSFRSMFNCIGDCGAAQVVENLPAGAYLVRIKVYDALWNFICEREERIEIAAVLSSDSEDQLEGPSIESNTSRSSKLVVDRLSAFPNPTAESINLTMNGFMGQNVTITMVDMFGRTVDTYQLNKVDKSIFTIDVRGYDAGVYQVTASGKGKLLTTKIIVLR